MQEGIIYFVTAYVQVDTSIHKLDKAEFAKTVEEKMRELENEGIKVNIVVDCLETGELRKP